MKRRRLLLVLFILTGAVSANLISASEKIDINSAPLEDLTKIIHIGEARALELISLRPFSSLDGLTKIRGIGEARLADIKKQGLAQVEPNSPEASLTEDEPNSPEASLTEDNTPADLPQKELAAVGESFGLIGAGQTPKHLYVFLIAGFTSLFGGGIILMLKKKLKLG